MLVSALFMLTASNLGWYSQRHRQLCEATLIWTPVSRITWFAVNLQARAQSRIRTSKIPSRMLPSCQRPQGLETVVTATDMAGRNDFIV